MTAVGNGTLVIVGGRGGPSRVYDDVWKIVTDKGAVRPVKIGHLPQGIHSHSACSIGTKGLVVVTGGINPGGTLSQRIFVIDAAAETIRTVSLDHSGLCLNLEVTVYFQSLDQNNVVFFHMVTLDSNLHSIWIDFLALFKGEEIGTFDQRQSGTHVKVTKVPCVGNVPNDLLQLQVQV